MAKGKAAATVQNRPMYSRISFLQQAATYLTVTQDKELELKPEAGSVMGKDVQALRGLARHMVTDLRSVSLKTRIRLSPAMKQTLCKFCDALLVEGQSCTTHVENPSRGGRKSWADVLVRKCHACGNVKRQPIHAQRQKSKAARLAETKAREQLASTVTEQPEAEHAGHLEGNPNQERAATQAADVKMPG
jgi:ribonuclease P protein subunit RPR2